MPALIIKPRLILVAHTDDLGWNNTSNQQQQMLIQNLNRIVVDQMLRQGRSCTAPQTVFQLTRGRFSVHSPNYREINVSAHVPAYSMFQRACSKSSCSSSACFNRACPSSPYYVLSVHVPAEHVPAVHISAVHVPSVHVPAPIKKRQLRKFPNLKLFIFHCQYNTRFAYKCLFQAFSQ